MRVPRKNKKALQKKCSKIGVAIRMSKNGWVVNINSSGGNASNSLILSKYLNSISHVNVKGSSISAATAIYLSGK